MTLNDTITKINTPGQIVESQPKSVEDLDDYFIAAKIVADPIKVDDSHEDLAELLILQPNSCKYSSIRTGENLINKGYFAKGRKICNKYCLFEIYIPFGSLKHKFPGNKLRTAAGHLMLSLVESGYQIMHIQFVKPQNI